MFVQTWICADEGDVPMQTYVLFKLRTVCEFELNFVAIFFSATFTFEMTVGVKQNEDSSLNPLDLVKEGTEMNIDFVTRTKDALESAFLSTDIKRQFQGTEVMKVKPKMPMVYVDFLVQVRNS